MAKIQKSEASNNAIHPEVLPKRENNHYPTTEDLRHHFKDLTWRDGAEILAEAANLIPGVGPALKAVLSLDKHSPEARIKDKQFKWVLDQIWLISEKLDDLTKELPENDCPEPADVAAIIEGAMETSRKTAGAKKRKLLKNAILNAFSYKQYQTGLTLRFFSILKDVEYGDVELLSRLKNNEQAIELKKIGNRNPTSVTYHHLKVLQNKDLVTIWNHRPSDTFGTGQGVVQISELGRKFIEFVSEVENT